MPLPQVRGLIMGRIKTKLIKRVTKRLVREHGDQLKKDFGENKQVVGALAEIKSKKLRNTIAGYVTRLMKAKEE